MRLLVPALCAAAAFMAFPAAAQTPAVSDEHCLLTMVAVSNSKDENSARMGQTGVVYFAGRVKGRDPNYDFAKLKAVAATMNAETAQSELKQHCGPLLASSMQQLQAALAPPPGAQPAPKPATPAPKKP